MFLFFFGGVLLLQSHWSLSYIDEFMCEHQQQTTTATTTTTTACNKARTIASPNIREVMNSNKCAQAQVRRATTFVSQAAALPKWTMTTACTTVLTTASPNSTNGTKPKTNRARR